MQNLGQAYCDVRISNSLAGVNPNATKYNFDITAYNWAMMQGSSFFAPLLMEQVADVDEAFACLMPSRRKYPMDTILKSSDGQSKGRDGIPSVFFTPTDKKEGVASNLLTTDAVGGVPGYNSYTLPAPTATPEYREGYLGPKWEQDWAPAEPPPLNDWTIISRFWDAVIGRGAGQNISVPADVTADRGICYIFQRQVMDGLWWAIETSGSIPAETPFWLTFKLGQPPSSVAHETIFIISIGVDDSANSFDLVISPNNKPKIIDYPNGRTDIDSAITKEFDLDLSRVLFGDEQVEIAFMTIAGRLVTFVNKNAMVYTRTDRSAGDSGGCISRIVLPASRVRVYGSNVQARIGFNLMTFAPYAAVAIPLPSVIKDNGGDVQITYRGVTNTGVLSGACCKLPQQPDKNGVLYGVDCRTYEGEEGSAAPSGTGFHQQGSVYFLKAKTAGLTAFPGSDFYVLGMQPSSRNIGSLGTVAFSGAPFFFRLKGGWENTGGGGGGGGGASVRDDVISATESASAPDYFHCTKSATVTLYNKDGRHDNLKEGMNGIEITWGWTGIGVKKTFTGVIVSATTSEVPGKETITLSCEDYIFILKNTPIVNSPFYDGMVAKYAIRDLVQRAGITTFVDNFQSPTNYFLPSGYTFSKPAVRYPAQNKIFDCIIDMCKRFESFIYFNENGGFVLEKLQGGLFSEGGGGSTGSFYRNPTSAAGQVILNEKNVELDFRSTVNRISILTLDRDTRNAIFYTHSSNNSVVKFLKVMLLNQAALGDIETARTWAQRVGERAFYPIKRTSFSTIGSSSLVRPLDYVSVDGDQYRCTGVSRKYNADNNDLTMEYNCEWLGGK